MTVTIRILSAMVWLGLASCVSIAEAKSSFETVASWYASGSRTADGSRFNPRDPRVIAHRTLPFGTRLRVTNVRNGRSLIGVVKDRGPFIRGRGIDVTLAGAVRLGFKHQGITRVRVEILGRP